jgi:anti-anti-sigma factor
MLTVTVQDLEEAVVLQCVGRIVSGDETALLCSAARLSGRNVMLDLSQVDTIDAAGIGLLVSLQAAGIYLRLMSPTAQVREILRVTQLESIFEISTPQSPDESLQPGVANDGSDTAWLAGAGAIGT